MNNIFFEPYKDTFDSSIPFSKITTDMYEPAVDRGIDKALAEVEAISNNPEPADMENTIRALDRAGEDLERVLMAFEPLTSALSSDEMMEIDMRISPKLTRFSLAIAMNERLWKRVREVYDMRHTLELDAEERMLLENRYFGFLRNGALLEGADRERFKEIASEISELTTRFGNNVLSELNATTVDIPAAEASGISEDLIAGAAKRSPAEGVLRFGLDQPTYMAVMKSADSESVRKKFYLAYCGRNIGGDFDNLAVLSRIAVLRRESAALLGFDNAASMIVERNMAHTPDNVMKLLDELRQAYSGPLKQELDELKEFAGRELNPWDYSYFANKLRQERYSLDEEELRPYLPLEKVVDATLALAGQLYGISFRETDRVEKYHPDVRVFEVSDSDDSYIGLLYMDFFTRETKRPGAWMTEFRAQRQEPDGTDVRPHITIVTNFAPPAGDKPALLRPRDVETLLHEFGHALHGLLSKCRYASTSGTNVRRDFVELPSQMNEGFATRKEFLDTAGFHYATGEPIPPQLVEAWKRSGTFGAAYQCMRQLGFGYLDMAWHMLGDTTAADKAAADPVAFEREAIAPVRIFDDVDGCAISPQFSHIFAGGYAAGYYSYKWAEVLAADAFEAMIDHEKDEIDAAASASFRRNILERGGSDDPALLYRRFRGRDADVKALLRRDGLSD